MFPFEFKDKTNQIFLSNICTILAHHLRNKLDATIYELRSQDKLIHSVVYYQEYFIDILGIWEDKDELIKTWENDNRKIKLVKIINNEYGNLLF